MTGDVLGTKKKKTKQEGMGGGKKKERTSLCTEYGK